MQNLLQFTILGLGAGAAYALFAQGAVLIYRGSGLVNFAHGSLGMLAAYLCFVTGVDELGLPIPVAIVLGIAAAIAVSLLFQWLVLQRLRRAAAIVRLIATLGLLAVVQAGVSLRYGGSNQPVDPFLPHRALNWGGIRVQEQVLYVVGVAVVVTVGLWAFTRFTRTGLAITAGAENERAVQTLGWSPDRLARLTWALGAALAGVAAILVAPLTGLSVGTFTLVVTVAALAAALLGGFQSFVLTLVGGLVVGVGESLVTLYLADIKRLLGQSQITGLNRALPFLVILLVLVVRGRGLPLRSHVTDRLPRLGSGRVNVRVLVLAIAVVSGLVLLVFDDRWASATYTSLIAGVIVLSIVVLTGYAGQLSLAQWTFAGVGALIAGQLVRAAHLPMELAILLGIVLTIPVGLLFALPALRTRGVNLAVVTLGLGFTVHEVVFANSQYIGDHLDGGTRIGPATLFGIDVNGATNPHRWAVVCLVALVLVGLMVANLRRSRTGRRLLAVRTNERAAASLGISVFSVKLYAFAVAAGIAAVAGVLAGFQDSTITYNRFNAFASINAVGQAVIGGLGWAVGAVAAAPNAVGGLGSRVLEELVHLGAWTELVGGILLLVIIVVHQDGIAPLVVDHIQPRLAKLRLRRAPDPPPVLPAVEVDPVAPLPLAVSDLSVRFGGVVAVDGVSFTVAPGEVVGLIGPNGAGKTTIIDAVTGFVKPSAGSVRLGDHRIERWGATRRARAGLRRSFQSLELFEDISVEQNIHAGADEGSRWSWLTDLVWPGRHALSSSAVAAITSFELEADLSQLPGALPYGRRRLVGIARAVASGPSLVLLDEPAAGLDDHESRELGGLIRRLADDRGMGVLLVEHDVGMVLSTCDRVVVIEFGKVIAEGTPDEVRADPAVRAAYLGHDDDTDIMALAQEVGS